MPGYPGVPTLHPCTGTAEFWLWELLLQGHPVDVRDVRGGPNVRWRTGAFAQGTARAADEAPPGGPPPGEEAQKAAAKAHRSGTAEVERL